MPVRLIVDSEFLSSPIPDESMLRTPSVTDSTGGARSEKQASERGQMVKTADQVVQLAYENGLKVSPAVEASLLPTPALGHIRNYDEPVEDYMARRAKAESGEYKGMPGVSLGVALRMESKETQWGKFEPAIRRWEETLGRPAPAPTKPDGKDGAHRLSSKFTEWMMGLPDGWITDCGLTRNEELKACGNGVVPQQAELALRILLESISLPEIGGGQVNLPTPTVSDIFTSSLKSSQQKEGSMHSVTLPQAVERLGVELEKATSESL